MRVGGKVCKVRRKGIGPANAHASETSLDNYDFDLIVDNDSTLEAFRRNVRNCYKYSQVGAGE